MSTFADQCGIAVLAHPDTVIHNSGVLVILETAVVFTEGNEDNEGSAAYALGGQFREFTRR